MPQLTLGKIAALYGMHRSSVYEAVDKGRVSAGRNARNQRVIDLSEAIRCWGEPKGNPTSEPDNPTPAKARQRKPDTSPTDDNAELIAELRLLREEVRELRQAMLRIEHKPDPASEPASEAPGRAMSFSDLLAHFK